MKVPKAMTVAGSDPSGGAGIQADLKTFSACGVYGSSAIVSIVDENTQAVYDIFDVPIKFVIGQIDSVLNDVGADAVKIGMLHTPELMEAVARVLVKHKAKNIVLDPVMVATSGDTLMEKESLDTFIREVVPIASVITPNIPEAEVLLGYQISEGNVVQAAKDISKLSQGLSVLLKGGHLAGEIVRDVFYNAVSGEIIELKSPRVNTKNTHGTGCTLSSAITSYLAKGHTLNDSVRNARSYVENAIKAGQQMEIGKGNGPVHHFWNIWS